MEKLKIIIEGTNLSGKSSVVSELERRYPESVCVTTHGYYHDLFAKLFSNSPEAIIYHRNRAAAFIPIIKAIKTEEIIFNRLHITAAVYLELFYNIEEHFSWLEKKLDSLGMWLVCLDFDDAALEKRAAERIAMRKAMPPGDDGFKKTKLKRDLYRKYFAASRLKRKFMVDNSNLTAVQSVDQIAAKIAEK